MIRQDILRFFLFFLHFYCPRNREGHTFALELADYDINSNAVAAGWVESEQVLSNDRWKDALPSIPSRRLGKLSEIAESVAFLCNDKVSYINGEILDVNGGIIMD